ncbi:hypothetical protein SAMN06265365_103303 [Tistlia consotensis]|uniref:Cell division and transport-associated protein TolA n=1 Tax=Tistlia consotensis USBA 355 TaxID=560819 RepID=A0A1Y6C3B1_9PROT|nr:hypothetical protein [Tistlia consotensis]SMF43490.1 hypothetical protein SAMN05428998_11565 [Tistlia consotensis USBA 355]SNR42606.1 hypothetical protein SAMN06265365_103303 [Tistlia consotensis]
MLLHLVVGLLALFGPPLLAGSPAPPRLVTVDLVRLGEVTAAPPAPLPAPLPQVRAPELAEPVPATAVPVTELPQGRVSGRPIRARPAPDLSTVAEADSRAALPRAEPQARAEPRPAARTQHRTSTAEDLSAKLRRLAKLHQPAPPRPAQPSRQQGEGASNATASSAQPARDATYAVKDLIRAQVERRWNLKSAPASGSGWVVSIRILLAPDGSVREASVVETLRYRSDPAYRDFALSARNAVLLSSPLALPDGAYDVARDLVVEFDARQVLR